MRDHVDAMFDHRLERRFDSSKEGALRFRDWIPSNLRDRKLFTMRAHIERSNVQRFALRRGNEYSNNS